MSFRVSAVPVHSSGAAVFRLSGELDLATVDTVRAAVEDKCAAGIRVVLDLADVGFCDSTGLGMIVGLYRRAATSGGDLQLCGLQPRIRSLLEVSGVDRVIPVYGTAEDALAAPGPGRAGQG